MIVIYKTAHHSNKGYNNHQNNLIEKTTTLILLLQLVEGLNAWTTLYRRLLVISYA